MSNSFELVVSYQNQQHVFHIESNSKSLEKILSLIGESFRIDIKNYIVEVYDPRYKLFAILDDYYLTELRSNPYFVENNSVNARIRSRKQSAFNIVSDTFSLPTSLFLDPDIQPDHVIIWLDRHIGQPNEYETLKRRYNDMNAFTETNSISTDIADLTSDDIDSLIGAVSNRTFIYSTVGGPILYSFSDVDACLEFINRISTSQKAIFLICSGYLGRIIVPQIIDNMYVCSIYILTSDIHEQFNWVIDYYDKIIVFEHDSDLFTRLTRDIASYYGKKCLADDRNPRLNLVYLKWARNLYKQADKNDQSAGPYVELRNIEERIKKIESSPENKMECEEAFASDDD